MSDHQQIAQQIRGFIAATDRTKSPQLVDLAAAYAALCTETNDRLRRCADYLHKGLRAEAIHLAEEHPVLLEMAAALDLADGQEWEEICAMYQLARPPQLMIEAAQELNEAYAVAQPLQALLAKHRRLALGCNPLSERIDVMRELAEADPTSPFWEDDLRTLEAARVKELRAEAVVAAKTKDHPRLTRLAAELNSEGWRSEIPVDLRSLVIRAEAGCRQDEALRQIRLLMPELDGAYGAMDFDGVDRGVKSVRRLMADSKLVLPADLAEQLEPVEQWLGQQKDRKAQLRRFDAACQQLSLAIEGGALAPELEQLKVDAVALGGELPEDLNRRMRQAIKQQTDLRRRQAQRRYALFASIGLAACIVVALTVVAVVHSRRGDDAYRSFAQLVGNEDLPGAEAYWQRIVTELPYAVDRADMKRLRGQLNDALAREADRKTDFETTLKVAASDSVHPDMSALGRAESLAKTPAEKLVAMELRSKIEGARRAAKASAMDAFRTAMVDLTAKTESIEQSARTGEMGPADNALKLAEAIAAQLASEKDADAEQVRDLQALAKRLKTVRESLGRLAREREDLAAVARSVASPASLKQALETFVEHCPDSSRAPAFKQAAASAADWESVEKASELLDSWKGKLKPEISVLPQRLEEVALYAGKYVDSPVAAAFEDYKQYLTVWQKSVAADGAWRGDFHVMLTGPLLKELKYLKSNDGKRYYLPGDATLHQNSVGTTFKCIISGDVSLTKSITLKKDQFEGELVASPQSVLAQDLDKMVGAVGADWETFAFDVIARIAESKETDPILRVILMDRAMKVAQTVAWGAEDAMKSGAAAFADLNADDLAWMNPDDKDANAKRDKAAELLAKLSDLKQVRDAVAGKRDGMLKALRLHVAGHGVLLSEGNGWTIAGASNPEANQGLFAVVAPAAGGKRSLLKVANVKDGKFVVDDAAARTVVEGSMVFVIPASSTASSSATVEGK